MKIIFKNNKSCTAYTTIPPLQTLLPYVVFYEPNQDILTQNHKPAPVCQPTGILQLLPFLL